MVKYVSIVLLWLSLSLILTQKVLKVNELSASEVSNMEISPDKSEMAALFSSSVAIYRKSGNIFNVKFQELSVSNPRHIEYSGDGNHFYVIQRTG